MSFYGNDLMNNCVLDGNYPSYYATCNFLQKAYYFLNGRINKIKSLELKLDDFSNSPRKTIMGFNCVAVTTLLPYNITNFIIYLINNGITVTEESYKGELLFIVAHELSHVSQIIDYPAIESSKDKTVEHVKLEAANDGNAVMYLIKNKDMLEQVFGEFNFDLIFKAKIFNDLRFKFNDVMDPYKLIEEDSKEYREFDNANDKIKILLQDLYQSSANVTNNEDFIYIPKDYKEMFNGSIQNIQCSFTNRDGYLFSKDVYKNNTFDDPESNLRFLSEMFSTSYIIKHPLLFYPQYNLLLIRRDHSSKERNKQIVYTGEGH